jgi:hypothetical protein
MRYSKHGLIQKVITGVDGTERLYKARKMGAMHIVKEGLKLVKVILPVAGTTIDSLQASSKKEEELDDSTTYTIGAALSMLSENLTEAHLEDLIEKMMGSLMLGDEEIKDVGDHLDEYSGDFFELFQWLLVENFGNFIKESGMLASLVKRITSLLSPQMKKSVDGILKILKEEPKEELQEKKRNETQIS